MLTTHLIRTVALQHILYYAAPSRWCIRTRRTLSRKRWEWVHGGMLTPEKGMKSGLAILALPMLLENEDIKVVPETRDPDSHTVFM